MKLTLKDLQDIVLKFTEISRKFQFIKKEEILKKNNISDLLQYVVESTLDDSCKDIYQMIKFMLATGRNDNNNIKKFIKELEEITEAPYSISNNEVIDDDVEDFTSITPQKFETANVKHRVKIEDANTDEETLLQVCEESSIQDNSLPWYHFLENGLPKRSLSDETVLKPFQAMCP